MVELYSSFHIIAQKYKSVYIFKNFHSFWICDLFEFIPKFDIYWLVSILLNELLHKANVATSNNPIEHINRSVPEPK